MIIIKKKMGIYFLVYVIYNSLGNFLLFCWLITFGDMNSVHALVRLQTSFLSFWFCLATYPLSWAILRVSSSETLTEVLLPLKYNCAWQWVITTYCCSQGWADKEWSFLATDICQFVSWDCECWSLESPEKAWQLIGGQTLGSLTLLRVQKEISLLESWPWWGGFPFLYSRVLEKAWAAQKSVVFAKAVVFQHSQHTSKL